MKTRIGRRDFIKKTAFASVVSIAAAGTMSSVFAQKSDSISNTGAKTNKNALPKGNLCGVEISRIILGGNLVSGYAHARDLLYVGALMKHYYTESKILETLEIAEANGVNAINLAIWDNLKFLEKHWKNGGKMKLIAQALPNDNDSLAQFKRAVDFGACAVHIQGHGSEKLLEEGRIDFIGKIMEYIKSQKVPAGVAAHWLEVVVQCEKHKLPVDFYVKTLHTHEYHTAPKPGETGYLGRYDNSWCQDPEEVIEVMRGVEKPWIAFKVMAAGAIPPRKAFQYAFNGGADFIMAGMFDWQIEEDIKIAIDVLGETKRHRPWRG